MGLRRRMQLSDTYEFLTKYVPRTSESMLSQYTKEVESDREAIIRKHRTITLIPNVLSRFDFEEWFPDCDAFPRFAFKPTEVLPPRVSPQLLQQASHLYQFIQQNPSALFDGLMSIKGTTLYYFVVKSSIPSLFGYFSSQEHIQLAFSFYMHVLSMQDTVAGTDILFPFYNTPCVYKFIEVLLSQFCDKLIADQRIPEGNLKEPMMELYKAFFLKSTIKSASGLTHCHSVILKLMLQKWGMKATASFIINTLIKTFSTMWFKANGLSSKLPFLLEVIDMILKDETNSSLIVNSIVEAKTLLELPDMYNVFSHQYILFLSSVQDFNALMRVVSIKKTLPQSIVNIKAETNPPFSLFWFKIFPKRQMPKILENRRLVFPVSQTPVVSNPDLERIWRKIQTCATEADQEPYEFMKNQKHFANLSPELLDFTLAKSINQLEADSAKFESLMDFILHHHELEKWMDITDAHLRLSSASISALASSAAFDRNYKYINFAFKRATTLFDSRLTNQSQYLQLLQKYSTIYIRGFEGEIKAINKWWRHFLDTQLFELNQLKMGLYGDSRNALFWLCVERIGTINVDDLMFSFMTIKQVIYIIDQLAFSGKAHSIIDAGAFLGRVAILGHSYHLMMVYILISSLAIDNELFKNLCLPAEQTLWVILEAQMYAFLGSDPKMSQCVCDLQEKLRNIDKEGDDTRNYQQDYIFLP